ncbi:MAG: hypothetical protein JW750_06285, partial [Anaerolineaceae bacterium]|nr:hypothetical protein [Anaerolineaceae bacterium]
MNDFIPEGHEVILDTHLLEEADDQICAGDRLILRELAARYAELIQRPIEAEKRCLQSMKNDLQWVRPLAICFPETSWREILPQSALLCEGKLARAWEMAFRQLLFTAEMNSDQCLPPAFDLGYAHEGLDWGISQVQHGDLEHGSYVWDAPIQTEEDLALMRPPTMKVDFTATRRRFALAVETFGDLLPVRLKESWFWTTGLTQTLIYLRGLEQMMFDMMDRPAFLHALMERLR